MIPPILLRTFFQSNQISSFKDYIGREFNFVKEVLSFPKLYCYLSLDFFLVLPTFHNFCIPKNCKFQIFFQFLNFSSKIFLHGHFKDCGHNWQHCKINGNTIWWKKYFNFTITVHIVEKTKNYFHLKNISWNYIPIRIGCFHVILVQNS